MGTVASVGRHGGHKHEQSLKRRPMTDAQEAAERAAAAGRAAEEFRDKMNTAMDRIATLEKKRKAGKAGGSITGSAAGEVYNGRSGD